MLFVFRNIQGFKLMYNPGNLENNGANQDDVQKRNSENFVGRNMSLISNNANSPQSESASKTSTTAALRRWRRPEAQDSSSKNVSTRSSSSDTENGVNLPSVTVNQSKEMNPLSYANNTHHIDHLNGSASQNGYPMFVPPASLSPIVPQSTARPYDTNAAYIPRVPPETGAYSRTSPVVSTPNKLTPEVKSSDTTARHPISGNIQSPYYPQDNAAQQHYRNATGYPIQNTPPLTPTSTQSPIYGVPNQKRDYGYQSYTAKSPQEQRLTREHSVLTHSYSAGSGLNLDSSRVQGIGDDSKMNGYRQDSRIISQGYHLQNTAERRVTPPKPKSPTYRNFPNSSAMMDSRILAQNYVTSSGRVQAAELMAQNYFLNKSSCIVQEARVQNQIHSTENSILDSRYQQSYNSYIMPKSTVINPQDPKHYRNIITNNKKHAAPFPILEQRLNTAESYSSEYLPQNNHPQSKYAQVILPRSSPTSRRDTNNLPMHSNYIPQPSNQKCPQEMMIPPNYALHNKYFQQNANQDWRLIKDYEPNTHLNQMTQMHSRLPNASTNRTPEVPRDIPYLDQNQRIIQKPRMFYPEPGSVDYLQYAGKTNIPVAQKPPKVISYNVSDQRIPDQIQNDYLNLSRTSSNAVRPNEYSRNPVIQTPNLSEGSYIVHQAYRSDVPNDQLNYQMVQNSRHPSYAINYSNRQVKEIPPRNISPRRTFQENMPYFVISPPHAGLSNTSPPMYNSEHPQHNYPGYYSRDPNYPGAGTKPTIPQYPVDSTKYQNMAFSRNICQQRHPYGYQEQYIQRNMDPNQFTGNMYRQHNQVIPDQAVQARSYAEEYRNEDSMNSSYNEFERNRRKEEIGKSLKEFLESWEDDEDIVSNLPDLVLNIPADRQKNNSISSLESGENSEAGKTMSANENLKDNPGNPQAEPLYVLDARSISSDALSQYLPYCKVYQSLPENIRGFYPNSAPSEDASVLSQKVASETSETQPESEDLETNIIDSPSPHDLSVNRKTDEEDNVQAEVLNLSTNRNKENDEFMTEEYSNASDDTSVPENASSPSMSDTIYTKEDVNKQCELVKSPESVQNKNQTNYNTADKSTKISKEEVTKDIKIAASVENEDKRGSLETATEKPVTASVIVQNTFLPTKSDNSNDKSKENQPERPDSGKSSEEPNNKISKNDLNDENISASESKDFKKKRPSVDSLESADSIRTSLIESEIKDIDFTKDNLDDDQFDFDTALLSTETKDSNEDVPQDTKTDEDENENSSMRDNGIDLSLDIMLLSPEPIDTSFEDCIPEVSTSPKTDGIYASITKNKEEEEVFDKPVENVGDAIKLTENNKKAAELVTVNDCLETPVNTSKFLESNTNVCKSIEESNNSEKMTENALVDTEEHSNHLEIKKLDTELRFNEEPDSAISETNHEAKNNPLESNKESENATEEQFISLEDNLEKQDDYKIEISEKEMDLSTMDDENSVCESHFDNKSSFSIEEILKQVDNSKKDQKENIEAAKIDEENIESVKIDEENIEIVNIVEENIESDDSKLSETIEQTDVISPVNEEDINDEAESHSVEFIENRLEITDGTTDITSDNDEFSEVNDKKSDLSFISGDNSNSVEINNDEFSEVNDKKSDPSFISGDNSNSVEIKNDENSQRSLVVELSETRTSISPPLIEYNETSGNIIEASVDKDIQDDSIKCTDINEDILIDTHENKVSINDDSITAKEIVVKDVIIKNDQELSRVETESYEDSVELLSETTTYVEKIDTTDADINHKDTNEILNDAEKIEVSVINEEKNNFEDEPSERNVSDNNFNSPSVPIQEEITFDDTDKHITDEITKENQINEIEIVAKNNSNIDSVCVKIEEDITLINQEIYNDKTSIIKDELSLFDEDTVTGFEDLNQGVDKETEMIGVVKTIETEITIEELKTEKELNISDLTSGQSNDCLETNLNDTTQTVTDHASSDADEYQHLIKLEDEETLDSVDEKRNNTSINEEKDTTLTGGEKDIAPIDEEKSKTPVDAVKVDSEETSVEETNFNSVIIQSSSNVYEEKKDIFVESPKNIQDDLLINLRPENKSTSEENTIREEVLENKEIEPASLIEDDITPNVNVLLNEEILVEHILTNENITFIENNSSEITQEVEENIVVSDNSSCVVVYSDDENIVILQSNPNELANQENEDSTYITTEETNEEEALIKENTVVVDMEKEDFIPGKIIEEEIIGNEVIICENGIEDDWIQNEEIVETKLEDQNKKEDEKLKVVNIEKKRLLMEKRREKKRRLEKLRKRKLLSAIKATNTFLEEERNAYFITETLINEHSNSSSPFEEKNTDDKELFINPENPSSSEDISSMTHELLNLKPRIKRRYSFVDSSSPKIDFVAPKRRYSNMEYIRNNFKKPIINLDEISNNITKVIENLTKQENLQYHHSFESSQPTKKQNDKIREGSKVIDNKSTFDDNESKYLKLENEKRLGRFKIRKIINTDDFFVKPAETLVKPLIKPIINFNNEKEDKIILCKENKVQENQIEINTIPDIIIEPKNLDDANRNGCTKLSVSKNEDLNKLEVTITNNEDIFKSERNALQSFKQSLKEAKTNIKLDTIADSNHEILPSFQNYTDDLRKKIKLDVTNKDDVNSTLLLHTPSVVINPLSVSKISPRINSETENKVITTPLKNALILPNKQRNIDPRIDRPKETPKLEVSSVLIKNKTSKTFGLTEYTKHYLKMKTGQTIDPQINFGQNGIKRLDPRLTTKPEKITEIAETAVLSKESAKHNNDNSKSKSSQEKKVKINLQDYRNRKLSLSESEKQPTNSKEQLDDSQDINRETSNKSDSTNGFSNTEPCRFYIRDKSEKLTNLLDNKTVEKIVIKPKKILEKTSNDTFGVSKDNTNKQSDTTIYSTNNHNLDCNNLSNDNINKTLKSNLEFKIQKPKKRRKRFRNLDASDEDDEAVSKQQNVTAENQNGIVEETSLKSNEDSQNSSTIFKHSGSGDSNCSCCVDLNTNGGTTINNCGLKCHIKLNSLDNKIRNYEINKNTSGISNLKLTLKPVKKKSKPAFAEVLSSLDSVVENEVIATKRKPRNLGLNKCDSGKKTTMWTIKNKVPKVIIKRNASGYCAVFRDVSSNPIWQPKIRLKRQKYIESLVLSNQVKISKKIPS